MVSGRRAHHGDAVNLLQRSSPAFALYHPGFLQYVAPTLVLALAVLVFGEQLSSTTLLAFAFIWTGLAVYSVDIWLRSRRNS